MYTQTTYYTPGMPAPSYYGSFQPYDETRTLAFLYFAIGDCVRHRCTAMGTLQSARDSAAATASHKRPKVKSCRGFSWTKSSPALERNRFAVPEQKSSQISVVLFCRLDVNWLQRRTPRQGLLNAVGRQVPASLKNRTALRELHSLGWRVYLGVRPKFG